MINDNKGLVCPKVHLCELDDYLEIMFSDTTLEDYLEIMFSDTTPDKIMSSGVSSEPNYNETERWFFDSKCENFERVRKYILNRTPGNPRWKFPLGDIESIINDYLYDDDSGLITKNRLKPELDKGKKIKDSVLFEWFLQFGTRQRYKSAQDCLNRAMGANTQAESDKIKSYTDGDSSTPFSHNHHQGNMDKYGWKIANVVSKVDSETGKMVGQPDYHVEQQDFTSSIEEVSENNHMRTLLLNRFGEAKVDMYFSLWLELRYTAYSSKRKWAQARGVSYKLLTSQIEQVRNVFKSNIVDFGY